MSQLQRISTAAVALVDGGARDAATYGGDGTETDSAMVVMDGSMGRWCIMKGVPQDEYLWAGRSIVEERHHPIVVEAHMEYIQAGAKTITTNNYAVQPNYYRRAFPRDWEERIRRDIATAARLAVEARSRCNAQKSVRILGCLPPIFETHRPDLFEEFIAREGDEACIEFYRLAAQILLEGGVDALLGETLNGIREAQLVVDAVRDFDAPLLVSVNGALRSVDLRPQPWLAPQVAEWAFSLKANGAKLEMLGFNCAAPEELLEALEALEASGWTQRLRGAGVKLGAWANCGAREDLDDQKGWDVRTAGPLRVRAELRGSGFVGWCQRFKLAGATFCGGCCGSTPTEIRRLSDSLLSEPCDSQPSK